MIEETKAHKSQAKVERKIEINSSDDESNSSEETVVSERLDTEELSAMIAQRKRENSLKKLKEDKNTDDGQYRWKLSVVKHRRSRMIWEIFIIVIALYSVLVIPITIGINEKLWDPAYDYIDLFTFLVYVTDVFVNTRMTYLDS